MGTETSENNKSVEKISIDSLKHHVNEQITTVWIDKFLNFLRKEYFADFFVKNEKWLTKYGLYGLYVSAFLGLVISIVFPIRYDIHFGYSLGIGFAWLFACIITHYTACKFLPTINTIINTTPTRLSSKAFLDSFALIIGVTGVIMLCGGLYLWIKTSSFETFVGAIFIFIFCEYLLSLSLNPRMTNINITEETTAGEEFIGLLSFFMKSFLKLIPIIFGSGVILGIINLIELLFMKIEYLPQIIEKLTQIGSFTATSLLPVAGYFLFLVYYFMIDLASSVLLIPLKLDKLNIKNTSDDTN